MESLLDDRPDRIDAYPHRDRQFESLRTNEVVSLEEAMPPPGTSSAGLTLDMTVASSGAGSDIVEWRDVAPLVETISSHQFMIRNGSASETAPVEEILS